MPEKDHRVDARIADILALQQRRKEKEKQAAELARQIDEETKVLAKLVAGGAFSGDRLRDLVLQAHGVNLELEEKYRKLEERLTGKKGEFVLIRYPVRVRVRYGGTVNANDYRRYTQFRIALLAAEKLRLVGRSILGKKENPDFLAIDLPVEQYVGGAWSDVTIFGATLGNEKPTSGYFFEQHVNDTPPSLLEYLSNEYHKGDLLVGDAEIKAALAKISDEKLFLRAAKRLGRPILQPTSSE